MTFDDAIAHITRPGADEHVFLVCPDTLGATVEQVLASRFSPADWYSYRARDLLIDNCRDLVRLAGNAPAGGSDKNHIYISGLTEMPAGSVTPFLKVIEEGQYCQFILQSQANPLPAALIPLQSRCEVLEIQLLTREQVLEGLRLQGIDPAAICFYDGTIEGTKRDYERRELIAKVSRELVASDGRGSWWFMSKECVGNDEAFHCLMDHYGTDPYYRSFAFSHDGDPEVNRGLVAFLISRSPEALDMAKADVSKVEAYEKMTGEHATQDHKKPVESKTSAPVESELESLPGTQDHKKSDPGPARSHLRPRPKGVHTPIAPGKRGRPRKFETGEVIHVRLYKAEKDQLEALAKRNGKTPSAYLRELIESHCRGERKLVLDWPDEDLKALYELAQNFNDLGLDGDASPELRVTEYLRTIVRKRRKKLTGAR